ncbi:MAG: ABC transporter ATP-binding protein [Phycisphaeraceae bacterium]|nr:ABC transporter ATP-binding protein [Phycisphaeraceae bacterium]
MSTAISIRSLLKAFKGPSGTTRAVDSVSLEISPGELFFLLGPSGCGKTTLLRMVAGFIDPDDGQILLAPRPAASAANPPAPEAFRDVTHLAPNKRNTGMVFQSYALWPHMTVEQNVAFGLGVRKVARKERATRTAEALELVQMAHLAKRRPNQLSGGQQQRVALARALVIRPDVLLLDEPLSNLDAKLRLELRAEIRRVCKEAGLTTIYVTHDQKEALSMADRVAIMRDGKVVQTGTPADLYRRPAERFVAEFLGETNIIEADAAPAGAMIELKFAKTTLRADSRDGTPTTGPVLLSIRPEAIALRRPTLAGVDLGAANGAALTAEITETTYLGEIAQHRLKLADGTILRAAELNPAPRSAAVPSKGGARVTLSIQPHDIVVLPRA